MKHTIFVKKKTVGEPKCPDHKVAWRLGIFRVGSYFCDSAVQHSIFFGSSLSFTSAVLRFDIRYSTVCPCLSSLRFCGSTFDIPRFAPVFHSCGSPLTFIRRSYFAIDKWPMLEPTPNFLYQDVGQSYPVHPVDPVKTFRKSYHIR